jgi:hypothetical protein
MGGLRSVHSRNDTYIQNFGRKTQVKRRLETLGIEAYLVEYY